MIWHGYAKTKTELKAYSNESQIDGTKEALGLNFPKGSIRKLIGRELTWEDEPVELK